MQMQPNILITWCLTSTGSSKQANPASREVSLLSIFKARMAISKLGIAWYMHTSNVKPACSFGVDADVCTYDGLVHIFAGQD